MGAIREWLKGKKTFIVAIIGVIVNGLISQGYIDPALRDTINSILAFLGLGTLRAGMGNSNK